MFIVVFSYYNSLAAYKNWRIWNKTKREPNWGYLRKIDFLRFARCVLFYPYLTVSCLWQAVKCPICLPIGKDQRALYRLFSILCTLSKYWPKLPQGAVPEWYIQEQWKTVCTFWQHSMFVPEFAFGQSMVFTGVGSWLFAYAVSTKAILCKSCPLQ